MKTLANTQPDRIESVWFHQTEIYVMTLYGTPYVAMKPICENIGLTWQGQLERIKRDPILSTCVSVTLIQLPGDSQKREVVFLPFEFFHGWLFTINATRVKPELKDKVIRYQRECYRVLAEHFSFPERRELNKAKGALSKHEAYWFGKYPHWRPIREHYYTGYRFATIADWVGKSVSACRRAVKSMESYGIINPRQAALHRLPYEQYSLWLTNNPGLGW